jgi:hypothetical protein
MSLSFSKSALVWALLALLAACSPMKRLDLITEQGGEVVSPPEAGGPSTSTTPMLESTSVESIPTSNDRVNSNSNSESGLPSSAPETSDDDGLPPPYPACPPDKPYPVNGRCGECNKPGGSQCGPGYSCEIGRYVCRPFCSSDRDCMLREDWPLPVCDERYVFCRGCQDSFECSPGLICQYFQCVQPPPPPPEPTALPPQTSASDELTSPLDAAVESFGTDH